MSLWLAPVLALAASPAIFYSDVDSGPNTGGENSRGAFVTIYGKGFGATQGGSFVTVGGGTVAGYPVWSDTKIAVQLGSAAKTGAIVVNSGGNVSNGVPFTVRAGNIYFVATGGSDTAAGSVTAPWATISHARDAIAPGDIVYVRNGVAANHDDGSGWSGCLVIGGNSGTAGNPKALVVYPGETATIGSINGSAAGGCDMGIRTKGQGEHYWTVAGFTLRGVGEALDIYADNGWRIIGNDMSCPNGNDQAGCLLEHAGDSIYIYGNNIHHVGTNLNPGSVTALYHGVYLSDDTSNVWFGWNTIAYVQGCRGLQQNVNNPAADAWGLHIHDNIIHDTQCDGIVMTTVNPAQGTVELYNNIIYNAGLGPNNMDGSGAWSCMNLQGWDTTAQTGSGAIEVYNNTMYNCGTFANPPYAGANAGLLWVSGGNGSKYAHIRNNIVYMPGGVTYVQIYNASGAQCADSANCNNVRGSNNLFYGNGPAPVNTNISGSVNANPLFVNAGGADFHLSAGSPAIAGGVVTPAATDFDGVALPAGSNFPIGAYAVAGASAGSVSISVNPTTISLNGGGSQQFTAAVTGSSNTSVTWSMSPSVGTLTSGGQYTAPASITTQQTVTVTATAAADTGKSASAVVTLTPPAASVVVTVGPGSVSLSAGQQQQFTATVTGSTQTGVTWSMSPSVGTLTSGGLYNAPASITTQQTVTVKAVSVADASKSASAVITLTPATAAVTVSVSPGNVSLSAGQQQQFTATVTGSTQTGVTWSMNPQVGTLTSGGLYTAPASITNQQTVTVKAISIADPTKSASSTPSRLVHQQRR